jgi:hypothetical protein
MADHWLDSVLAGEPTPDAIEHMVRGVRNWWRCAHGKRAITLARCLGMPESPEAARLALRDHWLRQAALHIQTPTGSAWSTARSLHLALRTFRGHRWACWHDLVQPPTHATPLEAALHRAMRAAGGRIDVGPRRLAQILAEF